MCIYILSLSKNVPSHITIVHDITIFLGTDFQNHFLVTF